MLRTPSQRVFPNVFHVDFGRDLSMYMENLSLRSSVGICIRTETFYVDWTYVLLKFGGNQTLCRTCCIRSMQKDLKVRMKLQKYIK